MVFGNIVAQQISWYDLTISFVMLLPKKEHVLALFFDLDTTWKHGILSDLYDLDFRGHLPTLISLICLPFGFCPIGCFR